MSAWAKIGDTWRTGVWWENVSGTWRKMAPWLNVAGTWKQDPASIIPPLSVDASPLSVNGAISRPAGGNAVTNGVMAYPSGGTAPYSYAWVSGDGVMTATAPVAALTQFTAFVEAGETLSDTFTCTVTDAVSATASVSVPASLSNYGKQSNVPV